MFDAIVCKYLKPTATKGARIKATSGGKSKTLPYPHYVSGERQAYALAAQVLCAEHHWEQRIEGGYVPAANGGFGYYVFVRVGQ